MLYKFKMGNDGNKDASTIRCPVEDLDSESEKFTANGCRKVHQISNVRGLVGSSSRRDILVPNVRGLSSSVPKHITTFDEKYALRCLELIRGFALREAAWKFASGVDSLPDDLNNLPRLASENRTDVIISSTQDWTFGTVTYSPSMINILQSSLLQEFGSKDSSAIYGKTSLLEASEPVNAGFADSSKEIFDGSSHKLKRVVTVIDRSYISPPMHKRVVSTSSTISSFSGKSSSSASVYSLQGMLQCSSKNGLPHLVFTVDGKKEVLLANLSKQVSSDGKVMKHVYTFQTRKKGKKEHDLDELGFEIIGKMEVSTTSITIDCNNNTETMETRFVLSVRSNNDLTEELQTSKQNHTKHKRLTKKVVNALKSGHSFKRRSSSKFEGSSAIFEDSPWDPPDDMRHVETNEVKHIASNLELAAIVVREVFKNQKEEADAGGWGLKFLKRSGQDTSQKTYYTSSDFTSSTTECSTSLTVIIPAGVHGGPRTKAGGPSGLVERWANGGECDCGGWDIGCPLTILDVKPSDSDSLLERDGSGKCKSVNLFAKGSKQDVPVLKMVNIHEDLYYLDFQSTLSILQCFAIAASILHSRSPLLRRKMYRN